MAKITSADQKEKQRSKSCSSKITTERIIALKKKEKYKAPMKIILEQYEYGDEEIFFEEQCRLKKEKKPLYMNSNDIIKTFQLLSNIVASRINKNIEKYGEIKIAIDHQFEKPLIYASKNFSSYIKSLEKVETMNQSVHDKKPEIKYIAETVLTIFHSMLIALIKDYLDDIKKNNLIEPTSIVSGADLIAAKDTLQFFYKELKNDFFQTLTEEALSDFLEEKKLHIIENITEKEKTIFIFKIKEISKLK